MAKITIVGDAVVITSAAKLEDLELVQKYRPEALVLKDEEGNEVFAVGVGGSSINNWGVEFNSATHDERKLATITGVIKGYDGEGDVRELVADEFGVVFANLNKIEETLPTVIREIKDQRTALIAGITVL